MNVSALDEELLQRAVDRFWETVPTSWNRIRGRLREIAASHYGITVEQFHILRHVRKGIDSVSELAEVKQISRPAISQAVELLVEKGLIDRHKSTKDRRFVRLALTGNGYDLINSIFQEHRSWMVGKLSALQPDELACLMKSMDLLKEKFEDTEL